MNLSSPSRRLATGTRDVVRLTYTVEEAAIILGISRSAAYECARRHELPTIRLGRRLVVPVAAIQTLVQSAISPTEAGAENRAR